MIRQEDLKPVLADWITDNREVREDVAAHVNALFRPHLESVGKLAQENARLMSEYAALASRYSALTIKLSKLESAVQGLLNKVNVVTAYHRHGNAVTPRSLTELSNRQVEFEGALAEILGEEP